MSKKHHPFKFEDFNHFYHQKFSKYKADHPDFFRLDGRMEGGNRGIFAYFNYQNECWKIDADTSFEKIELAFDLLNKDSEALISRPTRKNKGTCLEIKGENRYKKKFYVYRTALKV